MLALQTATRFCTVFTCFVYRQERTLLFVRKKVFIGLLFQVEGIR